MLISIDEQKLHIEYEEGGDFGHRGYEMNVVCTLLKQMVKEGKFKYPTLIKFHPFSSPSKGILYKLGYGKFNYGFHQNQKSAEGLVLHIYDSVVNIGNVLCLAVYACNCKNEIKINTSVYEFLKDRYSQEYDTVCSIPDASIRRILAANDFGKDNIWNKKIRVGILAKSGVSQHNFSPSEIKCFYQNKLFHFYCSPLTNTAGKSDFSKEKILLRVPQFFEFDEDEDEEDVRLIFTTYNTCYYIDYSNDTAIGPFIINNIPFWREPVTRMFHSNSPYETLEFVTDSYQGRQKLLLVPHKKLLIQNYDSIQKQLIDSLLSPPKFVVVKKVRSNNRLPLFFLQSLF